MRDADGNTPLILAAQAGYTKIVEMLLARFPTIEVDQVNHLGQTALMKAAIQGRVACARVLLRAMPKPRPRLGSAPIPRLEITEAPDLNRNPGSLSIKL
ncbi:unnamed protein product [Nippostrongylus brasiliensis]|uniref:ANK_REP_REGION domain-containing protein n=1 Tax=Nippostrongylus brasiliensis TaxID=27835 RepID=A0A0N4YXT7_NIPBR|nr:unnamed protein product [Nippostrongylus brasiliensis]